MNRIMILFSLLIGVALSLSGCSSIPNAPADIRGPLRIVTTTTIIADVVTRIAGNDAEVLTILPPGADPHSYEATSADLRDLSSADIVFINGLHLEESLETVLSEAGDRLISLNDRLDPSLLISAEKSHEESHEESDAEAHDEEAHDEEAHDEETEHGSIDPHTWLDPTIVSLWVEIIGSELIRLHPESSELFQSNMASYQNELGQLSADLEKQFASLPNERPILVSEHDALAYFARFLDLETGQSVLPSVSTLAEPSAGHLAELHDFIRSERVPAIFVEAGSERAIVQELAADLGVPVVPLYIGSLSGDAGPATTYLEMMRYNADQIIQAFTEGD